MLNEFKLSVCLVNDLLLFSFRKLNQFYLHVKAQWLQCFTALHCQSREMTIIHLVSEKQPLTSQKCDCFCVCSSIGQFLLSLKVVSVTNNEKVWTLMQRNTSWISHCDVFTCAGRTREWVRCMQVQRWLWGSYGAQGQLSMKSLSRAFVVEGHRGIIWLNSQQRIIIKKNNRTVKLF